MRSLKIGSLVGIPCEVAEGPFENEMLVEFETIDGKVSGFASASRIQSVDGKKYIKGEVCSVERDHLVVMVEGSFFTTNGLANINSEKILPLAA